MRPVHKMSLLLLRGILLLLLSITPALAQNFATDADTVTAPADEVGDETIDEEDKAQIEQKLTAEELKQPISQDGLVLGEDSMAGEISSEYTLGFLDEIEIDVLRHPEVSGKYPINAEGAIQYEFVGDIKV